MTTLPRQLETPTMLRRRLLSALLKPPNWIARSVEKEKKEKMPRWRRKWERRRSSMAGEERTEVYIFKEDFLATSVSTAECSIVPSFVFSHFSFISLSFPHVF